jgi:hypothetical protein
MGNHWSCLNNLQLRVSNGLFIIFLHFSDYLKCWLYLFPFLLSFLNKNTLEYWVYEIKQFSSGSVLDLLPDAVDGVYIIEQ